MSGTAGTGPEIRPFRVTLRKNSSPTFGGASPRRAGPARRPSLTSPRVPSWRRSRNSCATGVLATTGGSSRAPHRTRPGPAGGSPSPQSAPNPRQPADGRSDTAVGTGGSRQSLARLSRRHPRRITPRHGAAPAPVPAIAAAARPGPENGGHPHGALPRAPVADWAVICVQLDPVRHRPIAWTKLRMIAVP
jgi:hypothetical protein